MQPAGSGKYELHELTAQTAWAVWRSAPSPAAIGDMPFPRLRTALSAHICRAGERVFTG